MTGDTSEPNETTETETTDINIDEAVEDIASDIWPKGKETKEEEPETEEITEPKKEEPTLYVPRAAPNHGLRKRMSIGRKCQRKRRTWSSFEKSKCLMVWISTRKIPVMENN